VYVQMNVIGYDPKVVECQITDDDGGRPYKVAYLHMQRVVSDHIACGEAPLLAETDHPTGTFEWLKEREIRGHEFLNLNRENEIGLLFGDEGPDPGMLDDDYEEHLSNPDTSNF